jgi:hypothetical protein
MPTYGYQSSQYFKNFRTTGPTMTNLGKKNPGIANPRATKSSVLQEKFLG